VVLESVGELAIRRSKKREEMEGKRTVSEKKIAQGGIEKQGVANAQRNPGEGVLGRKMATRTDTPRKMGNFKPVYGLVVQGMAR